MSLNNMSLLAFTGNGDTTLKQLGDGHTSDEEQFNALMDQGITFGKQYALKSGVALPPEQMALLTGDIVWLVDTTVKMPDGSLQSVLVPHHHRQRLRHLCPGL